MTPCQFRDRRCPDRVRKEGLSTFFSSLTTFTPIRRNHTMWIFHLTHRYVQFSGASIFHCSCNKPVYVCLHLFNVFPTHFNKCRHTYTGLLQLQWKILAPENWTYLCVRWKIHIVWLRLIGVKVVRLEKNVESPSFLTLSGQRRSLNWQGVILFYQKFLLYVYPKYIAFKGGRNGSKLFLRSIRSNISSDVQLYSPLFSVEAGGSMCWKSSLVQARQQLHHAG
jgi:hypothetical protein